VKEGTLIDSGNLSSTKSLISTVIALRMCYIRLYISLAFFLLAAAPLGPKLQAKINLVEPDARLISYVLNSGVAFQFPYKIVIHAKQHSIAC